MTLTAHEYAEIFPLMDESSAEWTGFVADIKANGLNNPIVTFEGKILDGRNRYRACEIAGVEPRFECFTGTRAQALIFVWSTNYHRRHLTPGQAAVSFASRTEVMDELKALAEVAQSENSANNGKVGAGLEAVLGISPKQPLRTGAFDAIAKKPPVHVHKEAAKIVGVDPKTMQSAITYVAAKRGDDGMKVAPQVSKSFESGRMPIEAAAIMVRKPVDQQRAAFSFLKTSKLEPTKPNVKKAFAEIARQGERTAALKQAAASPQTAPDLRLGRWEDVLAGFTCDTLIVDPPYSERTHAAATTRDDSALSGRNAEHARADDKSSAGFTPSYDFWSYKEILEFVTSWSPRVLGWMVALTDSELIPCWQDAYRQVGRYAFAPVPCVIEGMSVRITGDGPSSWAVYAMVARPAALSKWGTLPGAYVGKREDGASGGRGKPGWLMRALVHDYSHPGNLVCDPMAGWGTTLTAAIAMGRRAAGAEVDLNARAEALVRISTK